LGARCCPLSAFSLSIAAAPSGLYTLSLHDALPILALGTQLALLGCLLRACSGAHSFSLSSAGTLMCFGSTRPSGRAAANAESCEDRKSTRLNSSHVKISYAVFCLKKKKRKDEAIDG